MLIRLVYLFMVRGLGWLALSRPACRPSRTRMPTVIAPVCQPSPLDPMYSQTMVRTMASSEQYEVMAGGSDNGPLSLAQAIAFVPLGPDALIQAGLG